MIYDQLSKIGPTSQRGVHAARIEDLEPTIRLCQYSLSKAGGKMPPTATFPALQERLQELAAAEGSDPSDVAASSAPVVQRAEAYETFSWRGQTLAVPDPAVQAALQAADSRKDQLTHAQAAATVDESSGATMAADAETLMALHDKWILALHDAAQVW